MEEAPGAHSGDDGCNVPLVLDRTLPDHGGRCITALVPAILAGLRARFIDDAVTSASTVVVLVIDGLGWHQLQRYRSLAPSIAAAADAAGPITTVAPSTTAAALTSLTTGATPGEHGLVGYRVPTDVGLLNALRWRANGADARAAVPAELLQPVMPFCGQPVAVVSRAEFRHSGFTAAHLRGAAFRGWSDAESLIEAVCGAVRERYPLVYAYIDSLDKTAHEFGLGDEYRAVLAGLDQFVVALREAIRDDVPLLVTADHGVVDVHEPPVTVDHDIATFTNGWSGEARLLWLHARAGAQSGLLDACSRYADIAEVAPVEQVLDEQWFGAYVTPAARSRIGDVALVPRGPEAFTMPDEDRPQHSLIGRHGGLTAEEMLVPLAVLSARRG